LNPSGRHSARKLDDALEMTYPRGSIRTRAAQCGIQRQS
jgi:hypothetical protein